MIEKALEDLTEALRENTETLKSLMAQAEGGKASTKAETKASAKDEAKDEGKGEAKSSRGRRSSSKAPKEKQPSVAEMKEVALAYIDVDDEDEYEERKSLIEAIADHFGVKKFTEIEAKNRLMAKKLVEMATAGENVDPEDIEGAIAALENGSDGDEDAGRRRKRSRNDDI